MPLPRNRQLDQEAEGIVMQSNSWARRGGCGLLALTLRICSHSLCTTPSAATPAQTAIESNPVRAKSTFICLLLTLLDVALVLALSGRALPVVAGQEPGLSIPKGIQPCQQPALWPHSLASAKFPFLVHYHAPDEQTAATEVMTHLDAAWQRQINEQGYEPPPSDAGACGPDGRFDVFVWRGINTCQVNIVSEAFVTPWGGRASFMFVDPWGDYGGKFLPQTVAHEFNHATHATNDWYDLPVAFEMTATYVDQFYGDQVDTQYIRDFQVHPDWALLRNDDYQTWYMYGSFLYLNFLRDRYFNGDDSFVPRLWVAMRNHPDLKVNRPSFVDAVNQALADQGGSFLATVPVFARWRYYAGSHDDGRHFRQFAQPMTRVTFMPEATVATSRVKLKSRPRVQRVSPAPMLTGSAYLEVQRASAAQSSFHITLKAAAAPHMRWVVQAVPGLTEGSDGDEVDLSAGSARVAFTSQGTRTLILTTMPVAGFDANAQTDTRYPVSVRFAP